MRITPIGYTPQVRIHNRNVTAPTSLNFRVLLEEAMIDDKPAKKEWVRSPAGLAA